MKKLALLFIVVLLTSISYGQKREKVKGSKIVTIEKKEIGNFENLEIEDNLEILLIKSDKCSLEIEADDNLHSEININTNGSTLRLTTLKDVGGFKKFLVKVFYNNDFKLLLAKHESIITATSDIELDNFTIKSFDYSKIFMNGKIKTFTIMQNDKSKSELNLKAEMVTIELSKNAQLKALIASNQLKADLYQKSSAVVEGDVIDLKLRLDNSSEFTGMNLISKSAELIAEANTTTKINVVTNATIEASGKSEIQFYGDAKIELKKFTENTVIMKKTLK
ncbi:MAG: DUF2807 domain-containing protein [Flavobacterium sp.]|jgi:hypothetical protein|nr:DUF2807 domain-containing protein [Flavobacterium sp.]